MGVDVFNKEFRRMVEANKNQPTVEFINSIFKVKVEYKDYHSFLDNFLFDFGILTFSYYPIIKGGKYIPYINCTERNIFQEEKGVTELSQKGYGKSQCQKILAHYLLERLLGTKPSRFIGD